MSTERPAVDLVEQGLLPAIPAALLAGEAGDLLAPLTFSRDAAQLRKAPSVERAKLAAGLAVANAAYGHPRAEELAAKLAEPGTRVVVTGQQPGLFGGPLYTLTKAVAAVLAAERLEAGGTPAVALFWVSTEDHDYREVARASFAAADGVLTLDLGDDPAPLLPVGMRTLGPAMIDVLARLEAAVPGDRWASWVERLGLWYRPDARFGEAFSRLLVDLLGERCPLLVDAMLPAVKEAEQPVLERMVARRWELEEAFARRDLAIRERGFELQVAPQRGASPLFVLRGSERRRVEWRGDDRFTLRGADDFEESVGWLEELIAENPAAVNAGVMGRAAIQDAILGTSILLLGPGEASYIPQVAPAYEVLGITPPTVFLRPQAMVLAGHQIDKLRALGLDLERLVAPDFDGDRFLGGVESTDVVAPTAQAVFERLEELKARALEIDANLEQPWKKTHQQVERALTAFSGRVAAAAARRDSVARARLADLVTTCRPDGRLQERVLATAHFPGKYGPGLAQAFFDQLELDAVTLQVITP